MKTLSEAVKACGGVWPVDGPMPGTGILRGWHGDDYHDPDYIFFAGGPHFTRPEFEAEARRQGYVEGFEGHPDDVAFEAPFKDGWNGTGCPPPETRCQFKAVSRYGSGGYGSFADDFEACTVKYASENGCHIIDKDGAECFIDSLDYHITFRPLKSDRERWVDAAYVKLPSLPNYIDSASLLGQVYDALISGELPTPEVK